MISKAKTEQGTKSRIRTMMIGQHLARAAGKKKHSLWEKPLALIMARLTKPKDIDQVYLRDEMCDAGIEFSPDELRRFRQGE